MSKQLFDELIADMEAGNMESIDSRLNELSDEQLDKLFETGRSFRSIGPASDKKMVVASVCNLREKYLQRLITTSMVGFLFQMLDEHTVEADDLRDPPCRDDFMDTPESPAIPEGFNDSTIYIEKLSETYAERFPDAPTSKIADMEAALSEDDLLKVAGDTKRAFAALTTPEPVFNVVKFNTAQEEAIRQQAEQERSVIGKFLGRLFKYDPDVHVQEAKQPINDDPERVDPETLRGTHAVYDNVPPNDTHSRFNAYYEINYEKMREATKNIYNLKPDLEHAMIVYDVLDSAEEADAFIAKYGSTAKCDIVSFNLNKWTLMGPFAENRERVNYYDKHSNIIKAMLEQQESDNALAEDLMKNRVKSTKVKAEKVFGKDSPGFEEYRKLSPSELDAQGITREELPDGSLKVVRDTLVDSDTGAAITTDADGTPDNALEVPVTSINARTGKTTTSRIFTRASN